MSDAPSPFDRVPLELSWMIFDYAPESILALRSINAYNYYFQTSNFLRISVDDYALNGCSRRIVEELSVLRRKYLDMHITAVIPKTSLILFKLRMKLCGFPTHQLTQIDNDRSIAYGLSIGATNLKKLKLFGKCLGQRIGVVRLCECSNDDELKAVSTLIGHAKVANLSLASELTTGVTMKHLLKIIESSKVGNLSIEARSVHLPDSVDTLKKLSSLVLSLHIRQWCVNEMTNTQKYFFGSKDVDWAPIFIEMLFGKINELWIENGDYPRYVGNEGVDLLIKYLPRMNKNVSFRGTCGIDESAYNDKYFMRYDYEISITPSDYQRSKGNVLRIKHAPKERAGGRAQAESKGQRGRETSI